MSNLYFSTPLYEIMNYVALIAAILLLGGGGVAGATYVGEVDWEEWLSIGNHYEHHKSNRFGDEYSVIHTDPGEAEDGLFYAVTKCEFTDCGGPLILTGCSFEKVDVGYIFTFEGNNGGSVYIPGARLDSSQEGERFIISEVAKIEVQHIGSTLDECLDSINSAERFFNRTAEMSYLLPTTGSTTNNGYVATTEDEPDYYTMDWIEYFNRPGHYIRYQTNSQGYTFSIWHTDPVLYGDGLFHGATKLEFHDCEGYIIITGGCTISEENGEYTLTREGFDGGTIHLSDVRSMTSTNGKEFYVISDENRVIIKNSAPLVRDFRADVSSGSRFFKDMVGNGYIKLVNDLETVYVETNKDNIDNNHDAIPKMDVDYKISPNGDRYSVTDYVISNVYSDGLYHGHITCQFYDRTGSLVIIGGCNAVQEGAGYSFTADRTDGRLIFFPDARFTSVNGVDIYVISDSEKIDLEITAQTVEGCGDIIRSAEIFFNQVVGEGKLVLTDSINSITKGWDYRQSSIISVNEHTTPSGDIFTVLNYGIQENTAFETEVICQFYDRSGSLVIIGGCLAVEGDGGYFLTVESESVTVFIPGVSYKVVNGVDIYVLSDSNTIKVQISGITESECRNKLESYEKFFNYVAESGKMILTENIDSIQSGWVDVKDKDGSKLNEIHYEFKVTPSGETYCIYNYGVSDRPPYVAEIICQFYDVEGSLVITGGCKATKESTGYTLEINGTNRTGLAYFSGALQKIVNGIEVYVISDTNKIELWVEGNSMSDCRDKVDSYENFFNVAISAGMMIIVSDVDSIQSAWAPQSDDDSKKNNSEKYQLYYTNSGESYSVTRNNMEIDENGRYYQTVMCKFYDREGSIILTGGCEVKNGEYGLMFRREASNNYFVNIPEASLRMIDNTCYYVLSSGEINVRAETSGNTEAECTANSDCATDFLLWAVESGYIIMSESTYDPNNEGDNQSIN